MGSPKRRQTISTVIILTWQALGLDLAFRKAQVSSDVTWIGGEICTSSESVIARVKASIIEDIVEALEAFKTQIVIGRKELHTFVGRVNHAAGLLVTLRPFLQQLWAALYSESSAPHQGIWKVQIAHSLGWLSAFFISNKIGITRTFYLQDFNAQGDRVEFGTDASPWGLGGWISVNGSIKHHFSDRLSEHDETIFGVAIGHSAGQQIWEALSLLVALRLWSSTYSTERVILSVKSDNVSALTLLLKLRPSTPQLAIIGREIALLVAEMAFPPKVTHIPGIAHSIADELSRRHQPGAKKAIKHPALAKSRRLYPALRDSSWYVTLGEFE